MSAKLETGTADETSEIRDLLRQSLETLLQRNYSFEQRSEARRSPARESVEAWDAYAELGLMALTLPEEHGGIPAGLGEIAMVAELLGGAMTLEPYRPTMVAARLIAAAGTPEQQATWLPQIATGAVRAALAHEEGNAAPDAAIAAAARHNRGGWRLSGSKTVIAGADNADLLIISALTDDGIGLFLTTPDRIGRRAYRCFDWTGAADLDLDGVELPAEARLERGSEVLAQALDEATALACADAVGAIRATNRLVREHTGTRRQFGRTLDNFQVLQHRMVDMAIAEELAIPITDAAIAACAGAAPEMRARAVSAAKVKVGDCARYVGQQGVQIHGGMGLTQEYPASHLFARLGLFERAYGNRDDHLARYAALMPDSVG